MTDSATETNRKSPAGLPDRTPPSRERSGVTGAAVPLWRLYVMRVGYLVFGGGLAVVKWPVLLHRDEWTLSQSIIDSMLIALSVLALAGVRYPLQMLPILLFESAWKLLWLGLVALPKWRTGQLDASYAAMTSDLLWVVIVLAAIPWGYVVRCYVTLPGDRWRRPGRGSGDTPGGTR